MKRLLHVMLLLALMVPMTASAQFALTDLEVVTGVDTSRWHTFSSSANTFFTSYVDDGTTGLISLGMSFNFCGVTYTQFSCNSNGNFSLGTSCSGTPYGTPLSSSNAGTNAPKIIGVGRDMGTGSNGYGKNETFVDDNGDSVFVCELCLARAYGASLVADVKWQIQLNQGTGVASIVYGPAPAQCPDSYQIGAAASTSQVITINPSNHTSSTGSTSTGYSVWPGVGRYYEFVVPTCPQVAAIAASNVTSSSFDLSWTENGDASSWEIVVSDSIVTDFENESTYSAYSTPDYSVSGLNPNTTYYAYVRPNCGSEYGNWAGPITVVTACEGYTSVPYFQDFENLATGEVPNCWMQIATGSSGASSNFPCAYAHAPNARNSQVYFEMESNSGQTEIIALPEMDNLSSLELNFYYGTNSSLRPTLEVGVMEDTTFVSIETVDLTASTNITDYKLARVLFGNYTGDGTRIAMRATASGNYTLFIEDLSVILAPVCNTTPGSVAVSDIDSNSATLTWGSALNENSYAIYEATTDTWYSSYTNTLQLTGLNPNTEYSGLVYHVCSGGDTSYAVSFSFRTECGGIVLPYTEGFESMSGNPTCWNVIQSSGTYPTVNTGNAYAGNSKIDMYSSSIDNILATPKVYQSINTLETKFFAKKSSSSYAQTLEVGYTTNLDSAATYIQSFPLTTDYTEYIVTFAQTDVYDNGYIVFKKVAGGYGDVYIDDITIREASSCPFPGNFAATGTAAGEMSFAWVDSLGYAWQIAYGEEGFDVETAENIENFSDNYGTIYNLQDTVTYDFYLRTDCGSEQSYWMGPVTARPNLVVMTAGMSDTVSLCGGTVTDDGGMDGLMATNTTSYLVIRPSADNQTVALHGSVSMTGSYAYYTNYLYIYEGEGTNGRLIATYTGSDNNVNVASTIGALTLKSEVSYYGCPGFQFNVSCMPLSSCLDPYDVWVTDIAGGSATVNWTYGETTTPDGFDIVVTDTMSGSSSTFYVADSVRSYQIAGLNQSTTYRVTVNANCGSDLSNAIGTTFTTTCFVGGEIQVGDGSARLNSHPINTYYNYGTTQMLFTSNELMMVADTVFGIKLAADGISASQRTLNIYMDTTTVSALTQGSDFIVMNASNLVFSGTMVPVDGLNELRFTTPFVRSDRNANVVITIDDNTGSYASSSYWLGTGGLTGKCLWIANDNINVDPTVANSNLSATDNRPNVWFIGPCLDASCVAPAVAYASSTPNSITINWVPGNDESAWTVEYKNANDTAWTVFAASTNANTATITGLYSNTLYNFRVGSLCLVSNDVPYGYANGRTACDVMSINSLPYTDGFETYATGDVPNCWITPVTGTSGSGTFPSCYNYSGNTHSGNVYFEMEFGSSSATRYEIAALPAIDSINLLMLDFYLGTTSGYCDRFEVGVWEDSVFVPVDTLAIGTGLTSYVHHTVYFNNYTGNGQRIAFRASKASGQLTVFIDDLTLDVAPSCIVPTNFVSTGNTSTSIDLAWTNGTATSEWELAMDSVPFTPVSGTIINTNPYTVNGLTAGQDYYFYLRGVCQAGDTSEWVGPVHVVPGSWTMRLQQSDTITMCGGVIYDNGGLNGQYANNSNDILVIRPSGPGLAVAINGTLASEPNYDHLKIYEGEGTTGTLLGDFNGNANISVESELGPLTIQFTSDISGTYAGYALNVSCVSNTCPKVRDLVTTDATTSYITIDWTTQGTETEWEVAYSRLNANNFTSLTASTHPFTINNLDALSKYDVRVRPVCSVGDTGSWVSFQTSTAMCDATEYTVFGNQDSTAQLTTSYASPINNYYNYSLSQIILDQSSLGGPKEFVAVNFHYAHTSPTTSKNDVDIYIQPTTKSVFVGTSDFDTLDLATATKVYHGSLNAEQGWNNFIFDSTYSYDGTSNLMMIVVDNSGAYHSSSYTWTVRPDTGLKTIAVASDYDPIDPATLVMPSSYGSSSLNGRPEMQLVSCGDACAAPTIANQQKDFESITVNWNGNTTSYEVAIKAATDINWPASTTVTTNTFTFTGLYPNTEYDYRLRGVCDEETASRWIVRTVVTDSLPCFAPEQVTVSATSVDGATIAWTNNANSTAQSWVMNIFNSTTNRMDTVRTNPATITGLYDNTTYYVAIQSMCSATFGSEWSDTISFTTTACQGVSNVQVSNITATGATVTWTPGAGQTAWEVSYGNRDFVEGQGTVVPVTSTTYQITGLEAETRYDVYVRSVCAEGITSDWSPVRQFETPEDGGVDGIDGVDGNYSLTIYPNPTAGNTTISLRGIEGDVVISIVDMNGRTIQSDRLSCGSDCVKTLDVEGLAQGTYFVRVLGDGINSVRKLIVR